MARDACVSERIKQQHAAHVRVTDDRDAALLARRATLHALARVAHGLLVRALGEAHALGADAEAHVIHHGEHRAEALVRLADEVPTAPPLFAEGSTQVGLAWMPSLCSTETGITSLLSPGDPSGLSLYFGTTNSEMPFVPAGGVRQRASTRWTMFSAMGDRPRDVDLAAVIR